MSKQIFENEVIVCIVDYQLGITKGKYYKVIASFYIGLVKYHTIYNDHDFIEDFPCNRFMTVEKLREEKLIELGI